MSNVINLQKYDCHTIKGDNYEISNYTITDICSSCCAKAITHSHSYNKCKHFVNITRYAPVGETTQKHGVNAASKQSDKNSITENVSTIYKDDHQHTSNLSNTAEKPKIIQSDKNRPVHTNPSGLCIGSLNVCGLRHRLLYPDFIDFINEYDLFTVLETKLDSYDIVNVPGYTFISQHRKQKYLRKSGGIGLFVKDCYIKFVDQITTDSDYIMWVKLNKNMLTTSEDILLGLIYQPPESSRFYNADEAELFDVEITSMCIKHKYVYLLGDINARVSNFEDFTGIDNFISDLFEFDSELIEHFNKGTLLSTFNMSTKRMSKDSSTNNLGLKLLDICKMNNLFILNGRCDTDKGVGAFTFKHISVIDYAISSFDGLQFLTKFKITELDTLFTDGHACLSLTLDFKKRNIEYKSQHKPTNRNRPKWKPDKKSVFVENIDINIVNNIKTELQQITDDISLVTQDRINNITDKIASMFDNSANESFKYETYNSRNDKVWYGHECNNSRKKYLHSKNVYKINPSSQNKILLKTTSKQYKRTLNKHISRHKKKTQTKLSELHTNKPKDFWKILNRMDKPKLDENITIDNLYDYFKEINSNENECDLGNEPLNINISDDDEILNSKITENEIMQCAKNLKNSKSPSMDNIINEYIKSTLDSLLPVYQMLFNIVLESAILPESWITGVIKPIYKHKGDISDPANYRPITLVSCFGKLFTSILNKRLNTFLEHEQILNENQAGFRKHYSTTDHIFVLYVMTELLKTRKQKLFCTFIDFSKAFDSVWRVGLWQKLLANNVNGKIFQVIHSMYNNIKSCVNHNGDNSAFFPCNIGLRQGENLSPILFSLYLNDLESFLYFNECQGIKLQNHDFGFFINLLVLLYADDTIIMAKDELELQHSLECFNEYCKNWKLNINYRKTKIIVFGARNTKKFNFNIDGNKIEITDCYKYLGVFFNKSRKFHKARSHTVAQARSALFLLYKKIRNLNLSIDIQLKLFDQMILPILTYGCEIWGFENIQVMENVQNNFLRHITKLRKSTPIYMIHAELGRYPIEIEIKTRMISYWMSILKNKDTKLSNMAYIILKESCLLGENNKWISCIKNILQTVGRNDLWLSHNVEHPKSIKRKIVQTLKDQYYQKWSENVQNSSKGKTYNIFKETLILEPYLVKLPRAKYLTLLKFRTCNFKLPIETGRWNNIERQDRKCNKCNLNTIGDEYHYLFECSLFTTERKNLIKRYYYIRPNILKFKQLLQSTNKKTILNLVTFMKIIMNAFS
ncbi:MAG: reverse transcriptase family protein [Sedimenticola sp.]